MDLLTRWPALGVDARRARLADSLRCAPNTIAAPWRTHAPMASRAANALWRRDPSLWSADAAAQKTIANRLGWLAAPSLMVETLDRLGAFAADVKRAGFEHVVLMGMGGSSLAPEVLRSIVGVAGGWPRFHMLDSTDPAAVRAVAAPPTRTLYVLASKSGTTIEPNALAAHFRAALEQAGVPHWGDHFVAITDPGTALAERARADRFRELFLNPADIGGRYSALSFFGLVPAALMGQDVSAQVGWGLAMLAAAEGDGSVDTNPAVALGLFMAAGARAGKDKLTLLLPERLAAFGLWVEQLVAESTGKHGVGIVPIAGERPAAASAYSQDRVFVRVRMDGDGQPAATDLTAAGLPQAEIDWAEPAAIGAEFVRWEIATAVAGALLGINPFDEPNVQQAKDATRVLLAAYEKDGRLPSTPADATLDGGVMLSASRAVKDRLPGADAVRVLSLVGPGDYAAILAFVGPDPALDGVLTRFRAAVRDRTGAATMFGYGPRYLHSTGQLHKGGPNTGVFVLVTAAPAEDVDIPGERFSFGTLEQAQGMGDFASLDETGRRAVRLHLPQPDPALLGTVLEQLLRAI
jgi:glucose-6-phosphate isomerase